MKDLMLWLAQFVQDSKTDKPSVKRFGLALVVTVLTGVLFGFGVAIALAILQSKDDSQIEMVRIAASSMEWISTALIAAVSGTYVTDKHLGRKNESDSASS